jgi:hypothetical protein
MRSSTQCGLYLFLLFFMVGCASFRVQIPNPAETTLVFAEKEETLGYLDIMQIEKFYEMGEPPLSPPISFQFSVRKDEKGRFWEKLGHGGPVNKRISLPPGNYIVRVDINSSEHMQDVPVVIKPEKFTLLFYESEIPHIANHESVLKGSDRIATGGYKHITFTKQVPYFVNIKSYLPISNEEETLQKTIVTTDWRVRAHAAMLLGQYGTKKSLPILKSLKDDEPVRVIANRAVVKIKSPISGYETGGAR